VRSSLSLPKKGFVTGCGIWGDRCAGGLGSKIEFWTGSMGLGVLVWAVRGVFDIIFVASWVGGGGGVGFGRLKRG
jgi:hypothetical protein